MQCNIERDYDCNLTCTSALSEQTLGGYESAIAPKVHEAMDEEIIAKLFEIEAIRFGKFKLKTGLLSPIYFNLRVIIGYPDLLCQISELLQAAAETAGEV